MSDRIIVATFNDTNAAYDAARALKDLKQAGIADFKLKTGVMLKKDDRGNVSLLESKDRHLLGTAVGTATGLLIGAPRRASAPMRSWPQWIPISLTA